MIQLVSEERRQYTSDIFIRQARKMTVYGVRKGAQPYYSSTGGLILGSEVGLKLSYSKAGLNGEL